MQTVNIGPYAINGRAVLAPMAGITDAPFRQMCRESGSALVTGEMTSSNPQLRGTLKSRLRSASRNEPSPRIVQIVGTNASDMADAAEHQVAQGAQIIDINMGCPAKKVCKKLAGSALLKDPMLVQDILTTVVARVNVPVTLKMRTGWDRYNRNAVEIAKIAEQAGIQSLAVHGRTRSCRFNGQAEYDTLADVVHAVNIPVFANGDIDSAAKAKYVLDQCGADGVMIGRAARGRPWIFMEINTLLGSSEVSCGLFNGKSLNFNDAKLIRQHIIKHLQLIHGYYAQFDTRSPDRSSSETGEKSNASLPKLGIKVARKHVCWYFEQLKHVVAEQDWDGRTTDNSENVVADSDGAMYSKIDTAKKQFNQMDSYSAQLDYLERIFEDLQTTGDIAA